MKILKRTLLTIILLLTTFVGVQLYATDGFTEVISAKYRVTSREEVNHLPYGITHIRDISESSTRNGTGNAAGIGGGGALIADKLYPQQVNVLEVPSSEEVKVVSWSTTTQTKWNLNTVRTIARDYEKNHPGWKVIGAINGDFFDINAKKNLPYQTGGASVSGGDFYKSASGSTVGFTNNGTANSLIGGEKVVRTTNMKLAVYDDNNNIIETFEVEKRNAVPAENQTSVYFANWNDSKQIDPIEIPDSEDIFVVENAEKALANSPTDFYGRGVITSTNSKTLDQGEFAIVTNNPEVRSSLAVGKKIRVQYEYTGAYAEITDATGAGVTLLKNGVAPDVTDKNRHPRTMIGKKEDGTIVMAVIDGRQPKESMFGATQDEMAALMKHYGCVDAFNLDGGGSSTLIIKEGSDFRVTNLPSDGRERTDANAILVVALDPEIEIKADVTVGTIKVHAEVVNNYGVEVNNIFVKINNEEKQIVDGEAFFDNLEPNTKYLCEFLIEDSNGKKVRLVTQQTITTAKRVGFIKGFKVTVDGEKVVVEVNMEDPDKSITRASVVIGDERKYINSSIVVFTNPNVNLKKPFPVSVEYRVETFGVLGDFDLKYVNPNGSVVTNYIGFMLSHRNNIIDELLK